MRLRIYLKVALAIAMTLLITMPIAAQASQAFGATPAPTWSSLGAPSVTPGGRSDAGFAYDAARGQTVLFGGFCGSAWQPCNETWIFDGTTWTHIATDPAHTPPARAWMTMAYDPIHQVVVMFGGFCSPCDSEVLGDTWTWNGEEWTEQFPVHNPPARAHAPLVFDSVRDNVLMYGGWAPGTFLDDTWTWNGSDWTQDNVPGPGPRHSVALAFDQSTGTAVLFGGAAANGEPEGGTWTWDGANWTPQTPAQSPSDRQGAAIAYSSSLGQVVLFGGVGVNGYHPWTPLGDTWTWDGDNWIPQSPSVTPPAREGGMMTADPSTGNVVMYGGNGSDDAGNFVRLDDTMWAFGSPEPQSIWFGPLSDQTYGAGPIPLIATASSGLPVTYTASGTCTVSDTTLTVTAVGTCTVTASQPGNASWAAATPVMQTLTMTPAPLTISAVSVSRTYGATIPVLVPTYSGFVAGDTAASLTTAPTCTTDATASSPVGTYSVTCSGAIDPNYSFTYVSGTLTIAIADRFVTPTNTTLTMAAPGFLALTNASGATVVISTQPAGKLILGSGGAFTYVPETGFSGSDSFAYRLNTNGILSAPVIVTIYVVGTGMNCSKCNLSGLTVPSVSLTGANLSSANLSGTRLTSANLTGANLSSAALSYAALDHANLTGANVSGVVLSNASLTYANLTGANLAKATLTGAALIGATLTGANLSGANLSGATLTGATLTGVAWSNAVCPDGSNSGKNGGTCVGHLNH
jgi:uncharacterized protein YjbI with pentapeptide repeats